MNMQSTKVHANNALSLLVMTLVLASTTAMAQVPVDENGKAITAVGDVSYSQDESLADSAPLSATELEELVGPIALYPDDLLAIVLPASTYPLEIVQAARFLKQLESDTTLQPDEAWDESVSALINYPEVVQMMDDDIDWTWRLGEAVINQQAAIIAAVELFRDRAYAAGNLKSDEYQTVSLEDGAIEIEPVDEEIIYVPYYEPAEVVVYQPQPVYHYYPRAYPVYYYPYPVGHHFASGYFWGVTTAFTIGWSNHYLHVYHPSYYGHPYYGHHYYGHYYRRPSVNVYNTWYVNNSYRTTQYNHRDGDYWRPRQRSGSRPHSSRVRNRHYPPGSTTQNRSHSSARNTGGMELGLRERNRSSVVIRTDRQTRVATTAGSRRTRNNTSSIAQRRNRNGGTAGSTSPDTGSRQQMSLTNANTRQPARANNGSRRTRAEQPGIRFRERSNVVTAQRANNQSRGATSSARRQPSSTSRRTASNRQSTTVRTSRSATTQRNRPTTVARQNVRSNTGPRQQSARATAYRAPSRPATQPVTPRPQRVAAAAPQKRAPAQRQATQASNRGDVASKHSRKESSSRGRGRDRT